jgi:hypothetical protein
LKFEVIDVDGSSGDLIGAVETTMGALMGSKAQTFTGELEKNGKKGKLGKIIISCEGL